MLGVMSHLNFQLLFTILTFFSSPIKVSLEAKIKNKKSSGREKKPHKPKSKAFNVLG